MVRGWAMPSVTPFLVISPKVTRLGSSTSRPKMWARCQLMASPSRSGSVARYTWSAFLASLFSSLMIFSLPLMLMYWGAYSCSTSMPSWLAGKSRICPMLAVTS